MMTLLGQRRRRNALTGRPIASGSTTPTYLVTVTDAGLAGMASYRGQHVTIQRFQAQNMRKTADVVTFVAERVDEREVKPSLPGQYVTCKMQTPDGVHQPTSTV